MNDMVFFDKKQMFNKAMCILDNYDDYTKYHCMRVGMYTAIFLIFLKENNLVPVELENFSIEDLKDVVYAGFVHDLGKVAVTDSIINNEDKLTKYEWDQVKDHTMVGAMFFRDKTFKNIYDGVLMHHERIDGTGYPLGKSGENIPVIARIVAIADVFDAMTDKRSYVKREAMSLEEYMFEIQDSMGSQFDYHLTELFLKMCKDSKYDKVLYIKNDENNFLKIIDSIIKWLCSDDEYEIGFIRKNNEYKIIEKEKIALD